MINLAPFTHFKWFKYRSVTSEGLPHYLFKHFTQFRVYWTYRVIAVRVILLLVFIISLYNVDHHANFHINAMFLQIRILKINGLLRLRN